METPIRFYHADAPYGEFSSFSWHRVQVDLPALSLSVEGPTLEHVFQAWKFLPTDAEWATAILEASSPKEAFHKGNSRDHVLRPGWEEVRDDVMRLLDTLKAHQNPDVKALLLSTGTVPLIEHTRRDRYWADGGGALGANVKGQILMEVRRVIDDRDKLGPYVKNVLQRLVDNGGAA